MYLKALEIQGFKSFPEKTRLTFEKDITAIVGPNGAGKSNISDAVLWVMGEQRSKALRGSKMEDVIFGGTEKRSALGYAQVSLIIDNTAGMFPDISGSELALTRRYYRSGDSEYYINKESVRLKDINSLLMDTGLGRDGYSIIGQGKIADIVSTRASDRREVFEEAAGISRFRFRKEDAEQKLSKTEDNLLRVNDKIEELELQVGPLKKQSEVAKKYLILRDDLRLKEISVWMAGLDKLHAQEASVNAEHEQLSLELEKAKSGVEALYASSDSLTERMRRLDEEREARRDMLIACNKRLADCQASITVLKSNADSGRETKQRLLDDIANQETRAAEIQAQISAAESRLEDIRVSLGELAEELRSNSNVMDGYRIKLGSREESHRKLSLEANHLSVEVNSTASRIKLLSDMEKDYEGYSKAVKTVMREAARGNLRGVRGPVANLIRTDDELSLAIETALGAAMQNIVVDTKNDGSLAIELLKRLDSGRATFLPLDTMDGTVLKNLPKNLPGLVGPATELVRFEDRYAGIIRFLLGKTLVAETLADAVRISSKYGTRPTIVTLDGQIIHSGGSMTGGSSVSKSGIFSRSNELEKLRRELEALKEEEKLNSARLDDANSELSSLRYSMDIAQEDRTHMQTEESRLSGEREGLSGSLENLRKLLLGVAGDSEARRSALAQAQDDIDKAEAAVEEAGEKLAGITSEAGSLEAEIDEISTRRLELEGKRTRAEKESQERSNGVINLNNRLAKLEQKMNSSRMEEKNFLDKLWDNYELSYSEASKLRAPIESLAAVNAEINELKRGISDLGTPNLGAIEEYERVSSRYNFLSEQRDDVQKARTELLGIIRDITKEMESLFLERFREIDRRFRETFLELFGGGKASLVLEDEENVLECGIDIKVQPPGKALSTISLLSGGETAFVAIALYFAILKVRPTPFCVMDEIDAALDETNVSRFAEYMRRMSDKTQFLVITHRRGTMEQADMLYGVTMQEKGVSTVLELDLEAAGNVAEE